MVMLKGSDKIANVSADGKLRRKTAPPAGASQPFHIDPEMKELIESGVAVLVATGDAERRPHVTYGWGPRVRDDGTTVDVFLDRERSAETLRNAKANAHIAMTVAHPVSYRSAQFKGCFIDAGDPTDEDEAWVRRHREAFVVSTSLVGDPPGVVSGFWMDDVVRVTFRVERAYNQTPGPDAGKPL